MYVDGLNCQNEPGSSVSIVSGRPGDRGSIPGRGERTFPVSSCVPTSYEANPASCLMGTGDPFPGAKARPGCVPDHSPPFSAEVDIEYQLYLLYTQAPSWRIVEQQLELSELADCLLSLNDPDDDV
jgi:hypothetical protein